MSHFYFALTNTEAESLLKKEIAIAFPDLKMSFTRPGFLTFKGERPMLFKPHMARLSGICRGKIELSEIQKLSKAWVWKRSEELTLPTELTELSNRSLFKMGELVTLVMMIDENQFWLGEYELINSHFQTPGEVSSIEKRQVPSRAYYKIAEAHEAFDLPFDNHERVLELGSAPGGASLFLLDQDMFVLGVDPAEMDAGVLKHTNFKHLRYPFETLTEEVFLDDVDWIVSDVNLPPTVVTKEVDRLLSFLEPRGLVLTLKLNQDRYLRMLKPIVESYKSKGFKRVELKYLPSHRQEIALIALRS